MNKKILNDPAAAVEDYIRGLVAGQPHLARVADWPVVVRDETTRKQSDRVAIVSGGGSGHEPAHAGYVGHGMLDAAVLGPVFTSPSVDSILAGIRSVATDAGVLLIVKNYTGDRLNFGLAAALAQAEGIESETVLVADDAALGDSSRAGRRGLTGTVLAHKVAGAAAERGWPLSDVADAVRTLLDRTATMGVALGGALTPGATSSSFDLAEDEVEWGLGIHGEVGRERGPLPTSRGIAARLVDEVLSDLALAEGADVVVVVNSLGGTPDLELRILQGDVLAELWRRDLNVAMSWGGALLTSLEMPGASLTVAEVAPQHLELLGDETRVVAFPHRTAPLGAPGVVDAPTASTAMNGRASTQPALEPVVTKVLEACLEAVIAAEPRLTELDRLVGDGDLGTNLARGARAVQAARYDVDAESGVSALLFHLAQVVRRDVGGTSGPLYSLLLVGAAESLSATDAVPTADDWSVALSAGVDAVRAIGGAAPGDCTMVDALEPARQALAGPTPGHPFERAMAAARAARAGADSTAQARPSLGRGSYVGDRAIGVPDPGAVAVAVLLDAAATALAPEGSSGDVTVSSQSLARTGERAPTTPQKDA